MYELVTPAKATEGSAEPGVHWAIALRHWRCTPFGRIPAFAGMTATFYFIGPEQ